jgi:hypothetical protein
MSILPKGRRKGDVKAQSTRWKALKFRLALAARRNPIQVALLVSLAILSYPVFLLVQAQHELESAQRDLTAATIAIQESRSEAIRRACEEQNQKNKQTTDSLTKAAQADVDRAKTPAAKKEIMRRRDVTLALLNLLTPRDNCEDRVRRLAPDTTNPFATPTPIHTPTPTPTGG